MIATITRPRRADGQPYTNCVRPSCTACNWVGTTRSTTLAEGRALARRDADEHNRIHHATA
jgi:hypothetical protein